MPTTLNQAIAEAGSSMNELQRKRHQQYEKDRKVCQKETEDLAKYGKEASLSVRNRKRHDR